jgi:hypothetical protein
MPRVDEGESVKRLVVSLFVLVALAATACGAKGDRTQVAEEGVPAAPADEETVADVASVGTFGDLEGVCGPDLMGTTVTVDPAEAGAGTDKLYLGTANERASQIRPGLLKEMWDASVAFTEWCNAQGGIGGLEIELVDLDGEVLKVEEAMATACADTFAMVGGGYAQDLLVFSGKPTTDFHECGLIAVTGFAVSTDFAEANGVIQPVPNVAYEKTAAWFEQLVELYPEKMEKTAIVWGQLDSLEANKDQMVALGEQVDGVENVADISYDAIGTADFNLIAQQVLSSGATAVGFVGEPNNLSKLSQKLLEQGYEGVIFADTNHYDELLLTTSGPEAAEGLHLRSAIGMFEEATEGSATQQLLDVIDEYGPDNTKLASLTGQSFSAWLLFAVAANDCAKSNDGVLTRDCVMESLLSINEWTGGGLHAEADPGNGTPPECSLMIIVKDGEFTRLTPELDADGDDGDGFNCGKLGVIEVEGSFGEGKIDPSRPY